MSHPSGATRFICHMDLGTIAGQIGVETDWIPFHIKAIIDPDRQPAVDYYGPGSGANVVNQDLGNVFGTISRVADAGKTPLAGTFTGPFQQGGTWSGYVKYIPKQSSGGVPGTPNAITFGVGARDFANYLMGDSENWCLVTLQSSPVPAPTRCPMCGQLLPPGMGG